MKKLFAFLLTTAVFFIIGFIGADFFSVQYEKYRGTQQVYDEIEKEEQELQEAPVTASLVSDDTGISAASYAKIPVISANATSTISQEGVDNSPMLLFDGLDDTNWEEGVDGYGIGESISMSFDKLHDVKYLAFKLGNWKDDKYYYGNAKPKTLTIELGDYTGKITFTGKKIVEWVELSSLVSADSMRITIDDVYKGTTWEDTCITEITIYGN